MNTNFAMPDGGLYRPENEHDACGVGLVVNINGNKYHSVVDQGLCVLEHMAHRGAEGADNKTGDGAGILVQIPHEFILLNGIPVPEKGRYGVGMVMLPREGEEMRRFMRLITEAVEEQSLTLMASRNVPVDSSILGADAAATEPRFLQIFITGCDDRQRLEELLYVVRKRIEFKLENSDIRDRRSCYIASLSTRTIVYKGMLSSRQLRHYFTDLQSPYFSSAIALVHSRFSTNTFPTWSLAQPFRLMGHNGEINTIRGNRLWMGTREAVLDPHLAGDVKEGIDPIIQPGMSDSASFDNALEFFVRAGMSLPHVLAMLVPESFNEKNPLSKRLKSFYEYHSIFMAPWDGPAAILFSDGRYAGGMLDRNGLRPARYLITRDGLMVIASETGVLQIPPAEIESKGRLEPGKILMVDTEQGQILTDAEIKRQLAEEHPYDEWLHENRIDLSRITSGRNVTHRVGDYPRLLRLRIRPRGDRPHHRTDGPGLGRPRGLDGRRHAAGHPLAEAPALLRLLPPAVRTGNQPPDGLYPRGAGHVADELHRRRAQEHPPPFARAVQGGDDVLADHLRPRPGHPPPSGVQGIPNDHPADALCSPGRRKGPRGEPRRPVPRRREGRG